jgi:protein tyrosine phosphatase (PTP) superfamily phosphohydrolase (DUF442 family)
MRTTITFPACRKILSVSRRRVAAAITASLLLPALLHAPGPAMAAPPRGAAAAPQPSATDLPNFAVVAPGIYRGAAPTPAGLRRLKEMGVRTIIDLRIEKRGQAEEAATAAHLGLDRLRLRMGREAPTSAQVRTFLATLADPAKRPVFVHCQHGADRTGAMIGIYRVTQQGWDFERTWSEMRRFGFKPYLSELKQSVATRAAAPAAR